LGRPDVGPKAVGRDIKDEKNWTQFELLDFECVSRIPVRLGWSPLFLEALRPMSRSCRRLGESQWGKGRVVKNKQRS
jgi:hypothetical protein